MEGEEWAVLEAFEAFVIVLGMKAEEELAGLLEGAFDDLAIEIFDAFMFAREELNGACGVGDEAAIRIKVPPAKELIARGEVRYILIDVELWWSGNEKFVRREVVIVQEFIAHDVVPNNR